MSKYAKLEELREVAEAFCKKMNYEYIFANENKFGFEDNNGNVFIQSKTLEKIISFSIDFDGGDRW